MNRLKSLRIAASLAIILSFLVVLLGAFTRLTDAGLGCPDWPGCYGHMVLPKSAPMLQEAQSHYPAIPIESGKAWTEMVHRYAAGTLALLILWMSWSVVRDSQRQLPKVLPLVLVLLVMFQAALGMWTVTLKLLPAVVMGHLLGGLLIFASLTYWRWQLSEIKGYALFNIRVFVWIGLILVFCQIALGGWVSSNYAGIACLGFPTCNGAWWPKGNFASGFDIFTSIGANYQGGLLDNDARVAIQLVHRLGAIITASYIFILSVLIWVRVSILRIRIIALLALGLVIIQFLLGVLNVIYLLPLAVAVAHNGVAALLLATMTSLCYLVNDGGLHARH